jgi:uncharacterized membrane protein YjjP (DUF1212 family)
MSDAKLEDTNRFLMLVAELLHRNGTPSHRFERVMHKISKSVGVHGVFLYTPTSVIASLGEGENERTYLRRVDSGAMNADKLIRFDDILERLEEGQIDVRQAESELRFADRAPPPFGSFATLLACSIACGCVAIFFQGGWREVVLASALGGVIFAMELLAGKLKLENGLVPPLAGFLVGLVSLAANHWYPPLDYRLVTLSAVVVLLPGFAITTSLTELACGHLSSGVARLAGASALLLTLMMGVALALRVGGDWRDTPASVLEPLPEWAQWLALVIAPGCFCILFRVRFSRWVIVFLASILGFLASKLFGSAWGVEVGSFMGALVVGCISNLYARIRDRPALVPLAPGMIILVPGSFGFRSLTAMLEQKTLEGVDFAFAMILVAVSLVGGLLAASAVVPPNRIL